MTSFFKSAGFKKYFLNSNWLFAEKFFKMIVSLVVGIYVARYLGPENFGVLSYSLVLVSLTRIFWILGLGPVANKGFIEEPGKERKIFGAVIVAQSVAYLIVAIIFFGFLYTSDSLSLEEKIVIGVLFLGQIALLSDVVENFFNANVMSKYISVSGIVAGTLSAAARVVLVLLEMDLVYFAIVVVVELSIKAALLFYFYQAKSECNYSDWSFDARYLRSLLKDSWPFILTGVMTGLYLKIDQLMIKHIMDNQSVGLYAVAVRLSEVWFIIPMVLTRSLFPAILKAKQKSEKLFNDRMTALYSLLILAALAISFITWFSSEAIVSVLFGEKYLGAGELLAIYVWAIVFIFINNAQWKWYLAMGYQRLALYRIGVGLIINVILNLVFIEWFGIVGAAYSTLITYAYVGYFGNVASKKLRPNFVMISKAFLFPFRGLNLVIKGVR
jgi:O-antigen/teichoic acid export membrane protein